MRSLSDLYGILGFHFVEAFKEDAGLAYLIAGHEATLLALLFVYGFLLLVDFDALGGVYHIYYRLRTDALHLLYQLSHVPPVSERTINALRREVVQLLVVGVHYDLLLVCVFQRFYPGQRQRVVFLAGYRVHTDPQTVYISSKDVHEDGLRNIVCIVASDYLGALQLHSSSLQSLPPEYSTVGAVIGLSDRLDHFVHGPTVEFFIGEYLERELFVCLVAFDGFQRVISIPFDSFVDGKHVKFDSVVVLFVEFVEDMHEYSGILAATGADGYFFSRLEEFILDDGVVNFCFEAVEEAVLADGLLCLGSFDHRLVGLAGFAQEF